MFGFSELCAKAYTDSESPLTGFRFIFYRCVTHLDWLTVAQTRTKFVFDFSITTSVQMYWARWQKENRSCLHMRTWTYSVHLLTLFIYQIKIPVQCFFFALWKLDTDKIKWKKKFSHKQNWNFSFLFVAKQF